MPSNSKIDKVKSKSKACFDYAEPTQERIQNQTCLVMLSDKEED